MASSIWRDSQEKGLLHRELLPLVPLSGFRQQNHMGKCVKNKKKEEEEEIILTPFADEN